MLRKIRRKRSRRKAYNNKPAVIINITGFITIIEHAIARNNAEEDNPCAICNRREPV